VKRPEGNKVSRARERERQFLTSKQSLLITILSDQLWLFLLNFPKKMKNKNQKTGTDKGEFGTLI
jgi:hypothetical protein